MQGKGLRGLEGFRLRVIAQFADASNAEFSWLQILLHGLRNSGANYGAGDHCTMGCFEGEGTYYDDSPLKGNG